MTPAPTAVGVESYANINKRIVFIIVKYAAFMTTYPPCSTHCPGENNKSPKMFSAVLSIK